MVLAAAPFIPCRLADLQTYFVGTYTVSSYTSFLRVSHWVGGWVGGFMSLCVCVYMWERSGESLILVTFPGYHGVWWPATMFVQGVVAHVSPVEVFVTRIKMSVNVANERIKTWLTIFSTTRDVTTFLYKQSKALEEID